MSIITNLGPYQLNTIVTGDARVLSESIPDSSVDLIFTDPVYQNIADYEWLARTAARVLKPDGHLLTYVTQQHLPDQLRALSLLKWSWLFTILIAGRRAAMWQKKIQACGMLLAWHSKSSFCHTGWVDDFTAGVIVPNNLHKWSKFSGVTGKYMLGFVRPGDLVADFFCGGGTVPAVAKMLGVNYWACEIDPITATRARARIVLTQPPLFVMQPELEQLELLSLQDEGILSEA